MISTSYMIELQKQGEESRFILEDIVPSGMIDEEVKEFMGNASTTANGIKKEVKKAEKMEGEVDPKTASSFFGEFLSKCADAGKLTGKVVVGILKGLKKVTKWAFWAGVFLAPFIALGGAIVLPFWFIKKVCQLVAKPFKATVPETKK